MADKTGIEWTDATWNPVVGCSIVSPGCTNCYAMKMASRIEKMTPGTHYAGTTRKVKGIPIWTGKLALAPERIILQPLKWKRPRKIFVNSMGDLFHEDVPDEWIDQVFAVMALAPQHVFQVLTKRSARMLAYLRDEGTHERVAEAAMENAPVGLDISTSNLIFEPHAKPSTYFEVRWPLPNVWLGVSAEDQTRANERIPDLLATPSAVRFISAEPLLGRVNLTGLNLFTNTPCDALGGVQCVPDDSSDGYHNEPMNKLDWVIAGGESGPGARPMHPDWARHLRDQCAQNGAAFLFKQWGSWKDGSDFAPDAKAVMNDGRMCDPTPEALAALDREEDIPPTNPTMMRNVGKKAAGRLLDGIEHNGFPAPDGEGR